MRWRRVAALVLLFATGSCATLQPRPERPNLLVIMADDLGFADLGSYGSEIRTPNLDALAARGVRLTGLRTSPLCAPSRAMLLTGVDNHRTGQGNMYEAIAENQLGQPGHEGYLLDRVATLPERLQAAGYRTYMAGKWNLGFLPENDPIRHGFDRSFAMLNWGAGNFAGEKSRVPDLVPTRRGPMQFADKSREYTLDGKPAKGLPPGSYATDVYVDKLLSFIDAEADKRRPFFAYLAFTAPHVPIQVPDAWLDRYRGRYDAGPAAVRAARIKRQRELGLFPKDAPVSPMEPGFREWMAQPADYQTRTTRVQEIYAAQVEYMDAAIGRLTNELKERGVWDNTVVVFLSDNGASNSETSTSTWYGRWVEENFDNRVENIGRSGSEIALGPFWAQVGSAPFKKWKYLPWDGGVRVPAFVAGPGVRGGRSNNSVTSILDIAPTLLEMARVDTHDRKLEEQGAPAIDGRSLMPLLAGHQSAVRGSEHVLPAELDGLRSIVKGDWKLVWVPPPRGKGAWELYNLKADPGETNNLAATNPSKRIELEREWESYVARYGVILPTGGSLAEW